MCPISILTFPPRPVGVQVTLYDLPRCHSSEPFGDVTTGVGSMTARRPTLETLVAGAYACLLEDRRSESLLVHAPPRITQVEPVVGPTGSSAGDVL
jgi:hypothetical protein